uniref:O-methyltransferase n=1 Tax=Acidobacterium capsulatum TaxID=33075 RepID=A0A7V5CSR5_9BACT
MSEKLWTAVEEYVDSLLIPSDPVLDAARDASEDAGLPSIAVSPSQGRLLYLLACMVSAKRILEIGTLGGYSTICMARALPADGRLVTLEFSPQHFEVALANIEYAGLSDRVDQRLGPALETLPALEAEGLGPFDFAFIDADKQNCAPYFEWALRLSRPGTVIVVDNVIREGEVIDARTRDKQVQGIRRFFEAVAAEPRVTATTQQTVGSKGYDGFTLIRVNS